MELVGDVLAVGSHFGFSIVSKSLVVPQVLKVWSDRWMSVRGFHEVDQCSLILGIRQEDFVVIPGGTAIYQLLDNFLGLLLHVRRL